MAAPDLTGVRPVGMLKIMSAGEGAHKFWLAFNLVDGIGTVKLQALLTYFGSIEAAWQASPRQLQKLGFDRRTTAAFLETRGRLDLDAELASVRDAGVTLLPLDSPRYPPYLKEVPAPPPLLYLRGSFIPEDHIALAVVGTRRLSSYGRQMARELTAGLVRQGITIVSGLARGIDTIAHRTALEMGGRTIAVLGSGVDQVYPPENRPLLEQILAFNQGAVLSEYPVGTRPQARNFPPRNRLISGLSLGTLVIEGDIRSGAMITARFALEQNRDVFAVPGNVTSPASQGPNALIREGAALVTCVEDILESLNLDHVVEQKAVQLALPDSAEEAALLPHLSRSPQHIDQISRAANLPSALVSSTLAILELKGVVQHVGGMKYALDG